jgi:hypothetical protein
MTDNFPELTSFGTLMKFALALEQATKELAQTAASSDTCSPWTEQLERSAKKHGKRYQELERMRRERLNEVVLQPISGMDRAAYVLPTSLPATSAHDIIAIVTEAEQVAARFYDDAAVIASNVLSGLDKTFKRLARENRDLAHALQSNT